MPPLDHSPLLALGDRLARLVAPRIVIRPLRPGDATGLAAFFHSLSPGSRARRFHAGMSELPPGLLAMLTRRSDASQAVLVAVTDAGRDSAIVAEARYVLEDGNKAEFALVVADRFQGCGLGKRLMRHLLRHAAHAGIPRIYGDVQSDNRPMLALAQAAGFTQRRSRGDVRLQTVELAPAAA